MLRLLTKLLLILLAAPLFAQEQKLPERADLEQKLNAQIPLNLRFRDETGATVPLSTYFQKRPVILQMGYSRCWLMCDVVTGGLVRSLQDLHLNPGTDFDVLFVSIDPQETWQTAARKRAEYVRTYGRDPAGNGWHFLTGDEPQIRALTEAVGFHYFYDAAAKQFAHTSGLMVATPGGRLSRYFYGVEFEPRSLRLALVDASDGKIGTPVDQLMLLCYHWNPLTGRYGLVISRLLFGACFITVGLLAFFVVAWLWRERRQRGLETLAR